MSGDPCSDPSRAVSHLVARSEPEVVVRRSSRRKVSVEAFREAGSIVVSIPASFTPAEEREWVARMTDKLLSKEAARKFTNEDLERRASELNAEYFGGILRVASVRWSSSQKRVWGTCTPSLGSIRLSAALIDLPSWVIDYVLVHELAHLLEPRHNDHFWRLVAAYPKTDRARGYLEGYAFSRARQGEKCPDEDDA